MAKAILSSYPDYGKAPPEYLLAVTEFIAGLTQNEQFLLVNPKVGIAAKCRFLPSIGDMAQLLLADEARREQFKPAHTSYRRFDFNNAPAEEPLDYRKSVVAETLGYDSQRAHHAVKPAFETIGFDVMEEARLGGKPLPLKTPMRPIGNELKQLLVKQGYGHMLLLPTEFPKEVGA